MADESGGRFSRVLSYWGRGGVAGLLAALLAVGVSELYAGIFGGLPSLLVSMSGRIVDLSPRAMEEFAISVFGTSDKLALVIFPGRTQRDLWIRPWRRRPPIAADRRGGIRGLRDTCRDFERG